MTVAAGILALLTGLAYAGLGVIAAYELGRNHKTRGFSYLGGAFALMAATCGPHHLVHAEHHLLWSEAASGPMLGALAIGFVPGGIFVLLRIEAAFGGRGDRLITGTPVVLATLPWVVVAACGAIVWEALGDARQVSTCSGSPRTCCCSSTTRSWARSCCAPSSRAGPGSAAGRCPVSRWAACS